MPSFQKGFSLIEVIVAISIIAGISGISVFAFSNGRDKSLDQKRKVSVNAIKQALISAKMDTKYYKSNITDGSLVPHYIKEVPKDPHTDEDFIYVAYPLGCENTSTCTSFIIVACLENANDKEKDTVTVAACLTNPHNKAASYSQSSPI